MKTLRAAKVLRQARESHGLTQTDLAEKSGRHVQYISSIERGAVSVSTKSVKYWCGIYGASPEKVAKALVADFKDHVSGCIS